jgi:hypothetical protein
VHHCNYFQQPETINFIRKTLGIKSQTFDLTALQRVL